MEAHLVSIVPQSSLPSCPPSGCIVVTGVLFELSDDLVTGSDWLEPLFQAMPLNEGVSSVCVKGKPRLGVHVEWCTCRTTRQAAVHVRTACMTVAVRVCMTALRSVSLCRAQGSTFLPAGAALDLQQLLPPGNQSYISYAGSLTTPPCTEGVLWVMLLNTQKMSLQQVKGVGVSMSLIGSVCKSRGGC